MGEKGGLVIVPRQSLRKPLTGNVLKHGDRPGFGEVSARREELFWPDC